MKAINPATGAIVKEYTPHTDAEVSAILQAVEAAFPAWRATGLDARARLLRNAATLLRERADRYGRLITTEMGKALKESVAEVNKCAWVCDYYADTAADHLADQAIASDAGESFLTFRPIGPVLAVMPWNFPFWQVFRFAAPGLMAGNVGLLKHASNVPGCALAIEEIFRDAGYPADVFRTLLIGGSRVADVIAAPEVKAVTLTGSTPAGREVAAAAGRAIKKTVLELGGSDPYLILEDANLDQAAGACVAGRLLNSGQSCIAAKRFIVVAEVADAFTRLVCEKMAARKLGDPLAADTDLGPMARADLRDELHQQVTDSVRAGARVLLGGQVPAGDGAYYPATVLVDVQPGMPAYDEEMFGPVAAIIRVADEAEAIRVANDTVFGLGAAVFTRDEARGRRIARDELQAGCCFVNDFVKSDPRLPFGGIKESGYGRELHALGIREFVNQKTVQVK
ncbi:succinate-semialdehyde dehydrogenase [bacterium DOLJORAL78_65_58]|nr:MAG: succinate-semialdehyde dehydrogenase [bacterium DOLZORAL124_64_63]PIE76330.1 MAG: succinate-semialdehyde dehydrogenase [bacterium DOLJORAL78_65_58]